MKRFGRPGVCRTGFAALAALVLTTSFSLAQPTASTKVLLDDANALVVRATYPPGATLQTSGPGRVIYVVQGPYRSTWKMPDGHTVRVSHNTGEAYWFPGGKVTVTNVGSNTAIVVAVISKKK